MYALHCTRKLLTRLKTDVSPSPVGVPDTTLGNWYATALFWKPQAALLVSELTLLPVLMPLAPVATLPARFPPELGRVLLAIGMPDAFISKELSAMDRSVICKTANRSLLGMLNEFSFLAGCYREDFEITDLLSLTLKLADNPCGPLKGNSPERLLRELTNGAAT